MAELGSGRNGSWLWKTCCGKECARNCKHFNRSGENGRLSGAFAERFLDFGIDLEIALV
jgi:hypothetical protein